MDNEIVNAIKEVKDSLAQERESLAAERRAFEQERAAHTAPVTGQTEYRSTLESLKNAMVEKRAITLNGSGAVAVVNELFKVVQQKTAILDGVKVFYGANSNTVIPILSPRPAVPTRQAEGASNISSDSTAALGATELKPETYVSVLPISFEALKYCGADIEASLNEVFAGSFAQAMANGMLTGRGKPTYYEMYGLFTQVPSANQIACAASGAPTMADLVNLALRMQDRDMVEPTIVMNPAFYAAITAAATSGYDNYKNELIINKTIEGVKVELSGKCPSTSVANDIMVVGYDKSGYAIGVASELTIEPIKKVGDTNTYFQATMAFDGAPIVAASTFALKAV